VITFEYARGKRDSQGWFRNGGNFRPQLDRRCRPVLRRYETSDPLTPSAIEYANVVTRTKAQDTGNVMRLAFGQDQTPDRGIDVWNVQAWH
jgi:hypothetical protein